MVKPRTASKITFPFAFEKNGRTGKIYKLGNGTFGTRFIFAGKTIRNTHATFENAFQYLDREFSRLDTDRANSLALHPLDGDVKNYAELEQLLRQEGGGASLREAVSYFLANSKNKRFEPQTFSACAASFLESQRANNISGIQIKTLAKHFRRFETEFATRKIHELTALEIGKWLGSRKDETTGEPWSVKTRRSVRGSLVSLSLYAQKILKAIPDNGETEFQNVKNPKADAKAEVEIYTPAQLERLIDAALETDWELIPGIILGNLCGLRPYEFHGEGLERSRLKWEDFNWEDKKLHVTGQKIRSKATRDIPLQPATLALLKPFKGLKGVIWQYKKAYEDKMNALRKRAEVPSYHDGFRHSYASYRIRQAKQDLPLVAAEMGNSPQELLNSYKRNVTDADAVKWFSAKAPAGYAKKIAALRQAA